MIEVFDDVFFNPEVDWVKQPQQLIELMVDLVKEPPYDFEVEYHDDRSRYKIKKWITVTETGTFEIIVASHYLYPITHRAFLTKEKQDTITLIKISDEQF